MFAEETTKGTPEEIEGGSLPDRGCFTVTHLHIEGVLSKRALAGDYSGGERGKMRSKSQEDDRG